MDSSVHDLSETNKAQDEQQKIPEHKTQSPFPASAMAHSAVAPGNIPFSTAPLLGAGQPMVPSVYPYPDPYYRSIYPPYESQQYAPQPYGGQPMVHVQLMGLQQGGMPLPTDAVEEPVFVNAKQYHGILRRRQSRAKAESENKAIKSRKPYLHESRHIHALKRARGCGGRFLNSKKDENKLEENDNTGSGDKSESNINLNSDRSDTASSKGKS
ncbi:Nuclear transcription factor Y subunit A-7 [Linum grandiflorum]